MTKPPMIDGMENHDREKNDSGKIMNLQIDEEVSGPTETGNLGYHESLIHGKFTESGKNQEEPGDGQKPMLRKLNRTMAQHDFSFHDNSLFHIY